MDRGHDERGRQPAFSNRQGRGCQPSRRDTCGCGRPPARRWRDDRPLPRCTIVGIVDDGDRHAGRASLRTAVPADSATTLTSYRERSTRVTGRTVLLGAAVRAGRQHFHHADAAVPGERPAHHWLEARIAVTESSSVAQLSVRRPACARSVRPPRPIRICRLVAAKEVEAPSAGLDRGGHVPGDHDDPRRQVACVRIDTCVVVQERVAVVDVDARGDPASPDRENAQLHRTIRPELLEEAADRRPGSAAPPARGREEAGRAPLRLVEIDERIEVGERIEQLLRCTSPTASARRTLRRTSWRAFLPSVAR